MSYLYPILFLLFAYFAIVHLRPKKHGLPQNLKKGETCLQDISSLFESLEKNGADGEFFVITAPDTKEGEDIGVNLQFLKENGTLGLNLAMNSKANKNLESTFTDFIQKQGYNYTFNQNDDVAFIQVEGKDLPKLATDFLLANYTISLMTPLELIVSNFKNYK